MILGVVLLAALPGASPSCGSNEKAKQLLETRLAQLVVGSTVADLRAKLGSALTQLDMSGGTAPSEVYLVVTARDGNRSASQSVSCNLNSSGRVVRCANQGQQFITQTVAEVDWNRVSNGESREMVYQMICMPGDSVLGAPPGFDAGLEYMVELTKPTRHFTTCAARILIKGGRVAAKELMCE